MTKIIKNCKGEKKRGVKSAEGFRKKLFIPENEIYSSIEHRLKSKTGKIFVNEKILEEHSVKIYEIDPYFSEYYKKRIQVDNNGQQYILFRIDVYLTKYCLTIEIDEKSHTDRDSIFQQKREETLEKKLNCTFIRFNSSKKNFDVDYEASRIQTFISQFKDNKTKKIDNKNKGLEDEIKKIKATISKFRCKK